MSAPIAKVSFGCEYTASAVRRALAAASWHVDDDEGSIATLLWAEFSAVLWDDVLAGRSTASCQYLRSGLVRKGDLLHYMRKHGGGHWHPTTIIADIEDEDDVVDLLKDWAQATAASSSVGDLFSPTAGGYSSSDGCSNELWVLKPSRGNRGEGISVLRSGDEKALRAAISCRPEHRDWLLQRYVLPLLLPAVPGSVCGRPKAPEQEERECGVQEDGERPGTLKFHLRVHVLAVGALSVWVHDQPLVLLASHPWRMPECSMVAGHCGGGDD
jgi:hypothetical protein